MSLLTNLLLFPITGPAQGISFILNTIAGQADQEFTSADKVREKLMELQLRYDMGEVSEEEYPANEAFLLERLNAIQQAQEEE